MASPVQFWWKAYEYNHETKNPDWYWALGIIAISLATVAILFNNILFAILTILGAFTIALYSARHPQLVTYSVEDRGIVIGNIIYPYVALESFWIDQLGHSNKLILRSKKFFMPVIIIPLEEHQPDLVHEYLATKLKEEHLQEPISHKIMERLGF